MFSSPPLLSTRRPPLVLVSLFTSSSGSERPSSLSSFRVFSQSFSRSARIRAGEAASLELGNPRGDMDGLPRELCLKIFHLLDHQSLASSPQVCRKWRALTSDDELWRKLFNDRWGADAAAFYAPEGSKSWKDVFAVQDRCDRYGLGVRIIREGLLPDLPGRDPEVLGLPPGHGWRLRRGRATAGRWRRASADIRPDPVLPRGSGESLRQRQTC